MRRAEKTYDLFSPPRTDMFGTRSAPSPLGTVRCAMSYLSEEESSEDDVERTRLRFTGVVRRERAPLGGLVRGMSLVSDNARYTVCSARCVGRLWVMALERIMFEGDGNA